MTEPDRPAEPEPRAPNHRNAIAARVLPTLCPPFRASALLLTRDDVAVAWALHGLGVDQAAFQTAVVPLTSESAFARAFKSLTIAAGSQLEPALTERVFFGFISKQAPSTFAVLPVEVTGQEQAVALLYVDMAEGPLTEENMAKARAAAEALGDAVAPLVAAGKLLGPLT